MRILLRPGRRGVLVKVEERGWTAFVVGGFDDADQVYVDLALALKSFEEAEGGAPAPRVVGERRPMLQRLLRQPLPLPRRRRPRRPGPNEVCA